MRKFNFDEILLTYKSRYTFIINSKEKGKGGKVAGLNNYCRKKVLFHYLNELKGDNEIDLTMTLASKIVKELTGKKIKNSDLLEFATKNRKSSDKSNDFIRIDDIVSRIKDNYLDDIKYLINELEKIKKEVKIYES